MQISCWRVAKICHQTTNQITANVNPKCETCMTWPNKMKQHATHKTLGAVAHRGLTWPNKMKQHATHKTLGAVAHRGLHNIHETGTQSPHMHGINPHARTYRMILPCQSACMEGLQLIVKIWWRIIKSSFVESVIDRLFHAFIVCDHSDKT